MAAGPGIAPIAPMAVHRPRPDLVQHVLTERLNYPELAWNDHYEQHYKPRDYHEETNTYLHDKIKLKPDEKRPKNWKFYKWINRKISDIPNIRGHSISDTGDSLITIGDHFRVPRVNVYKFNKQMSKMEKLESNGKSPCCRFNHCAEYIPSINCIFFFGGFDSQCNFNDARLLNLDELVWYDLAFNATFGFRAYHSSTCRLVKAGKEGKMNKWECYIFGGQYCAGGPYVYHDDILKFTFYDGPCVYPEDDEDEDEEDDQKQSESELMEKTGYFECEELQINGNERPCARSQSYSWIKDNVLYIYGGSYADRNHVYELNDLWAFDLNTNVFTEIKYDCVLRAPLTKRLQPRNYRVPAKVKPCYFDEKLNQLIVLHFGKLTEVQQAFVDSGDTLCEFEERLRVKQEEKDNDDEEEQEKPVGDGKEVKKKKGVLGMLMDNAMRVHVFVFDLQQRKWVVQQNQNVDRGDAANAPTADIGSPGVVRIGEFMVLMGGGLSAQVHSTNYMKQIYLLKLPKYRVMNTMAWSIERLIWIGHYQGNDDESDCQDVSVFNRCAKDVILIIISFLNPKPL